MTAIQRTAALALALASPFGNTERFRASDVVRDVQCVTLSELAEVMCAMHLSRIDRVVLSIGDVPGSWSARLRRGTNLA